MCEEERKVNDRLSRLYSPEEYVLSEREFDDVATWIKEHEYQFSVSVKNGLSKLISGEKNRKMFGPEWAQGTKKMVKKKKNLCLPSCQYTHMGV